MKNKPIDINQRIPLHILHSALESYLNDSYSEDYIVEQLRMEFTGDNRLKKALRFVNKIVPRNPIIGFVDTNSSLVKSAIRINSDRNIILISLLNSAFPFSFDVLQAFGKYFAVQDIINSESILKVVSGIYGGNRATENGIYSVVPMFLEAGLFLRSKPGFYQWKGEVGLVSSIARDIYIESFKHNLSISTIQEYQLTEPYFIFTGLL